MDDQVHKRVPHAGVHKASSNAGKELDRVHALTHPVWNLLPIPPEQSKE